ncbi:MAG: hypothetical protein V1800_05015 [Candidatus Latescibacterota bacterium]
MFPSSSDSCDEKPGLSEWLGRYACSAQIQLSRFEGSHLLDRATAPLPLAGCKTPEIAFGEATWQCIPRVVPVPDREGTIDLEVCFRVIAGEAKQCNVGVAFSFDDWSAQNYVLVPAAVYNGNRFESRPIPYPPMLTDLADIGPDAPPVITDVPRLNRHEGPSRIQLLTGDGSTPAVGFHAPESARGFWMLTDQHTRLGDSGITVQESADRKQATFTIAAPGIRHDVKYTMCTTQTPCDDVGANFAPGDEVTIRLRLVFFESPTVQALFDRFVEIRKDLSEPVRAESELPLSAAMAMVEDRYNHSGFNWIEAYGFYTYRNPIHYFGTGWAGGMIHTHPLLMEGGELSHERVLKTFGFFFNHMLAPSGLFYANHDGEKMLTQSSRGLPHAKNYLLIRRNCDALYFILKQFMLLEKREPDYRIPGSWCIGARRCAQALVGIWNRHGQFGQFVDHHTGEIQVGGSTSGALAPGVLALASQYFGDKTFLEVAVASGRYYYEQFVKKGISMGGPGEAMQNPDSESAFHVLESFVLLFEITGEREWIQRATEMAYQCATWCVSYDFDFPEDAPFARLGMQTTGTIWANAQNKHSAPGICTLSGDALLRLHRATGDMFPLELLRDIAHTIPQYLSRSDRPIQIQNDPDRFAPSGWINERVNMSDWEGKDHIGRIFDGTNWCETSLMLTYAEIPGLYVAPDIGLVCAIDHIEAEIVEHDDDHLIVRTTNPTAFEATVKVLSENAHERARPLAPNALADCLKVTLAPGQSKELRFRVSA